MPEYVPLDFVECQRLNANTTGASIYEERLSSSIRRMLPDIAGGEIGGRGDNHITVLIA